MATNARPLVRLLPEAEGQIKELGHEILSATTDQQASVISAIDGRMSAAAGALWHKQDRERELIPVGLF